MASNENAEIITLTGADDSVQPWQLFELSDEFPMVEWAFLVGSHSRVRYPSKRWFVELEETIEEREICDDKRPPQIALHICGSPLRAMADGPQQWYPDHLFRIFKSVSRIQLNLNGRAVNEGDYRWISKHLEQLRDIHELDGVIVQCGGKNDWMVERLFREQVKGLPVPSGLFDRSGGRGVLPGEWPTHPGGGIRYGYAGGLGPENVVDELPKITKAAGGNAFWIDMESRLFADDRFDLSKCRAVLEAIHQKATT